MQKLSRRTFVKVAGAAAITTAVGFYGGGMFERRVVQAARRRAVSRQAPLTFWLDQVKGTGADLANAYRCPGFVFDLRTLADQGVPGLTAGRFMLCAGPVLGVGPDVVPIGATGFALTPGVKAGVRSVLGIGEAILASTVTELVQELIVNLGSFDGVGRWKMGTRLKVGRNVRLLAGDVGLDRVVGLGDSEWVKTLSLERSHYQIWRNEALATRAALTAAGRTWLGVKQRMRNGTMDAADRALVTLPPPDQHQKAVGVLARRHNVPYQEFTGGSDDEGTRPADTTVVDTFNRADSTTVGTSSDGQFTWVEDTGDSEIVGNRLGIVGATGEYIVRAAFSFAADDHYSQGKIYGLASDDCAATRKAASSTKTFYIGTVRITFGNTAEIFKCITGTYTSVAGPNVVTPAEGDAVKLESTAADTQTVYQNGVSRATVSSEASITGNLQTGLVMFAPLCEMDDFEASDGAAAARDRLHIIEAG